MVICSDYNGVFNGGYYGLVIIVVIYLITQVKWLSLFTAPTDLKLCKLSPKRTSALVSCVYVTMVTSVMEP